MKISDFKKAYVSNLYDVTSDEDKDKFTSAKLSNLAKTYCINFDDLVEDICGKMNIYTSKSCDALLYDFKLQSHLLIEFKGGIIKRGKRTFSKADDVKGVFAKLQSSIMFLNTICKNSLDDMNITGIVVVEKSATFYSEKEGTIGVPIFNDVRKKIHSLSSNTNNLYPINSIFPHLIEIPFVEKIYTTDKEGLNMYVEKLVNSNKTIIPYSYPSQDHFRFYNI